MTEIDLISPSRQQEWGWHAVVNFILGGAGTGYYLINYTTMVINSPFSEQHIPVPHGLLALAIVGIGLICVAIEAGRPMHGYYILKQYRKSWISREIIAFTMFVSAVVIGHFFPHPAFNSIAAVSALCFMIIQGFIVYSSRAITLWNTALMPFIFLSSGLASGAGVALLFSLSDRSLLRHSLPQLSLLCVIFNLAIWLFYLQWYSSISFRPITEPSELRRRFYKMFFTIAFGHIISIMMLLLLWKNQAHHEVGEILRRVLIGGSGLTVVIGIAAQKAGILLSMGYIKPISLKVTFQKNDG